MEDLNLKLFQFQTLNNNVDMYIPIPYEGCIKELAYLHIINNGLPRYIEKDLISQLQAFIRKENDNYENDYTTNLITNALETDTDYEDLIKDWERLMREEMAEYGERKCASDEELFATAYHKMVHSPALETMLTLEQTYANAVRKLCEDKKRQITELSNEQAEEMNKALERLEDDVTESKINELASKHFESQSFLQVQLTSELDTIKEVQRREYREWLMQMLEEKQASSSLPTPNTPTLPAMCPSTTYYSNDVSQPILEESFTIHLGSQLKQMHNIRILSANVMDLCAVNNNSECSEPTPQILQTALNLYSNDLHGIVLMTDNIIGSRLTKDFREICQSSTEFHFPHIDDQLEKINTLQQQIKDSADAASVRKNTNQLQTGDFYTTKHSNLSQAHVIFHIVVDDTLRGSDMNSRHPVVLGLRNILKTACSNDVTSLTIPLLLNYEMTDEMTVAWCDKRAELVFKCVKGFMIEMASWGGSELKNLQFMLPEVRLPHKNLFYLYII